MADDVFKNILPSVEGWQFLTMRWGVPYGRDIGQAGQGDDELCIGDFICLYSEESAGYVFSQMSSTVLAPNQQGLKGAGHTEVSVGVKQHRKKPSLPNAQVATFKICVQYRYKASKKHWMAQEESRKDPTDLTKKSEMYRALAAANSESADNEMEQKRQEGKRLHYGQVIQLQHVFTKKFLHVSTTQTSHTEINNMRVELLPFNSKHAQYKIMPRFKVKAELDTVRLGDQIVLESVKTPGNYLHTSKPAYGPKFVESTSRELNLSVRHSAFTVYRNISAKDQQEKYLTPRGKCVGFVRWPGLDSREPARLRLYYSPRAFQWFPQRESKTGLGGTGGCLVRLYHKEHEAYMVASGSFGDESFEDVHLRVRPQDTNKPRSMFPSSSAITYWQVEHGDDIMNGNTLCWEQRCLLRHITTRKYLSVSRDGEKFKLGLAHCVSQQGLIRAGNLSRLPFRAR
ncbi:ITPR1 [Branchiostoma lanceolatum]|uniref:ITPR1 protein n=1 Tax=Branchiostoma lanceolatum TaxID=7740 RepID=A0A8J9YP40_BRALA|nr:ITPR1 [Branchiostoma lanceolatum]